MSAKTAILTGIILPPVLKDSMLSWINCSCSWEMSPSGRTSKALPKMRNTLRPCLWSNKSTMVKLLPSIMGISMKDINRLIPKIKSSRTIKITCKCSPFTWRKALTRGDSSKSELEWSHCSNWSTTKSIFLLAPAGFNFLIHENTSVIPSFSDKSGNCLLKLRRIDSSVWFGVASK